MAHDRSRRARARLIKAGSSAVISLATLLLTGCPPDLNTGGTSTSFNLAVISNADNTKNHPSNTPFSVNASCQSGQQLLGGGYRLINNSNAHPTQVVIEGDFPSAKNTWTVQARNPDNPSVYTGDADVVVLAVAYCLNTPNFDVSTEIVSQPRALAHTPSVTTDIDVRCSHTSAIALSGGFLTTSLPVFTEPGGAVHQAFWPGLLGTGITGSGPRLSDSTHSAMGWHIAQQYTPASAPTAPQVDVSTTAFVLCAQTNITDQAHRVVTATGPLSATAPTATLDPLCQTGEFTVGGGYDHAPLNLAGPSGVSEIDGNLAVHSPFAFNGWQISGDSLGSPVDALALCVRIPTI